MAILRMEWWNQTAALLVFMLSYILHPQLEIIALATSSDHDFSYMKSVYNATVLPLEDVYDYMIVGERTAGCPSTATLSEKYSVLVLESGSAPVSYPCFLLEDDGKTPFQRSISENGVPNARGRILGGSSMINVGFFSRADD
ncbi:(R)-mandelonitrile lyase 1 [Ziziphus jujuba]|uniref:(R)-mandelonitrile lyase 1 n=1 Tax=Ziziphus jujuba TaxID=326968 RepID=A0ABM3IXB0_ZIZJJ|nr:(R)-mandelonitrile lyase 1 [Ziziphus jujuba]